MTNQDGSILANQVHQARTENRHIRILHTGRDNRLIQWLRDEQRVEGSRGFIGFAISAKMSNSLYKARIGTAWRGPSSMANEASYGSITVKDRKINSVHGGSWSTSSLFGTTAKRSISPET